MNSKDIEKILKLQIILFAISAILAIIGIIISIISISAEDVEAEAETNQITLSAAQISRTTSFSLSPYNNTTEAKTAPQTSKISETTATEPQTTTESTTTTTKNTTTTTKKKKTTTTKATTTTTAKTESIVTTTTAKTESIVSENTSNLYGFSKSDIDLLACLVYGEAGNQSDECQRAVASVVINRIRCSDFPNTCRGVIYQKSQFTGGKSKMSDDSYRNTLYVLQNGVTLPSWVCYFRMGSHFKWENYTAYQKIGSECFGGFKN